MASDSPIGLELRGEILIQVYVRGRYQLVQKMPIIGKIMYQPTTAKIDLQLNVHPRINY